MTSREIIVISSDSEDEGLLSLIFVMRISTIKCHSDARISNCPESVFQKEESEKEKGVIYLIFELILKPPI